MEFDCTEEDRYFIASLVWRAIAARLLDREEPHFQYRDEDIRTLERVEAQLRSYLLGTASYPPEIQQHIFFSEPTAEGPYPGINTYLTATNDLQIIGTGERLYCFANLSGILLIAPLRLPAIGLKDWRADTRLTPSHKVRAGNQTIWDRQFGGILAHAAARLQQRKALISERQRKKVREEMATVDMERFAKSPHGRAILRDILNKRTMERDDEK